MLATLFRSCSALYQIIVQNFCSLLSKSSGNGAAVGRFVLKDGYPTAVSFPAAGIELAKGFSALVQRISLLCSYLEFMMWG